MRNKLSLLIAFLFLTQICILAQTTVRKADAIRSTTEIKVDGVLDEEIWKKAPVTTDFIQHAPNPGEKASEKTEVKIVYDDDALYIGAFMHDSPDNIMKELSQRDAAWHETNADFFVLTLVPFNDDVNGYQFWVSAAGTQIDEKATQEAESFNRNQNWDAVWESKVNITEKGWIVEMRVPYSEIRFPKKDKQVWGLNLWKYTCRSKEWTSFSFVNLEVNGILTQVGELHGIENIKPPLRLSMTPYLSNSYEKNREISDWKNKFGGGLDVKYGINESFTLDMMLIPDFTEVESDDPILNLTPFETKFEEKRQFFTEGTELFSKGNIFYSKRIGRRPSGYYAVRSALNDGTYKEIKENPIESKLINATKISGRTNKGLGIGFFNAMTNNTYAKVVDENDVEKRVLTEPFTNYNMLVLDQTFKNNSYVSYMNTNVWKERENYIANVTGTEFRLENKRNTYAINGKAILSQKDNSEQNKEYGHLLYWNVSKIKGNFLYSLSQHVESDDYNPNDMGFLAHNNKFNFNGTIEYNIYKPFGKFLNWYNKLSIDRNYLYSPRVHTANNLDFITSVTFKNQWSLELNYYWSPGNLLDYFYVGVPGKKLVWTDYVYSSIFLSTDNRKRFSMNFDFSYGENFGEYRKYNLYHYRIGLASKLRINKKLLIEHDISYKNNTGFQLVNNTDVEHIYLGQGKIPTINNTLTTNYIFNKKSSLNFRIRHYWSRADYDKFFELQDDGFVSDTDYFANHDINYNAFNIDFVYKWRFAPGSELSVIWKTAIDEAESIIRTNSFSKNFENVIDLPSASSISVKLFYYLDWKKFKKRG